MNTAPPDTSIKIESYQELESHDLVFNDGRGPDLIHAWTPRAHVARLVSKIASRLHCRYIVHMEDNEDVIVARELPAALNLELMRSWPFDLVEKILANDARTNISVENDFLTKSNGYSCLTEALLKFAPSNKPSCVFSPGFDPAFATIPERDQSLDRQNLGIDDGRLAVTYCGNVHQANISDMRSLYAGLALMGRRRDESVLLLRTGWDQIPFEVADTQHLEVRKFGFVERDALPALVSAADFLVQPGAVDEFNAYRFPSKVPDYLVSGRPVILPNTNIGHRLTDGEQTIKLTTGDAFDICACASKLADDPGLGTRIGARGRAFALQQLTWARAAETIDRLYREVMSRPVGDAPQALARGRFPVKLVGVLPAGFPKDGARRSLLDEAGIEISLDDSGLSTGMDDPTELESITAAALETWRAWSVKKPEEQDYMLTAAREIARLPNLAGAVRFVAAPEALALASVHAYGQWLRIAVRHAFSEFPHRPFIFLGGIESIIEDAIRGDRRCRAILIATRFALIAGIQDYVRPFSVEDEARFLAETVYREGEKRSSSPILPSDAPERPNCE